MYMPNDPVMQNVVFSFLLFLFLLFLLTFNQESFPFIHEVALFHLDKKVMVFVEVGTYVLQTNLLFSLMNDDLPVFACI